MPRKIDLTGQMFGRWEVLYYAGSSMWHCRCSCEKHTEKDVNGYSLKIGDSTSCGCYNREVVRELRRKEKESGVRKKKKEPPKKEPKSQIVDIIGQKFGRLTVKRLHHTNHGAFWLCECDCQNHTEVVVLGTKLRRGAVTSCGCELKERITEKRIHLSGKLFGRLYVLGLDSKKKKWECVCECGNICYVISRSLVKGETTSCGCYHREATSKARFNDLTGKRFNFLEALECVGLIKNRYYWRCKCHNCGNENYIVNGSHIRRNKSCGCLDVSHYGSENENKIVDFISANITKNIVRHRRKELKNQEIDIYLPEYKIGIEYNGSAYHASKNGLWRNTDKYYHRDKFLLAKSKGIHLITVFDIDFDNDENNIYSIIKDVINNKQFIIPKNEIEYTNNDYDVGFYMKNHGYVEIGQEEPESFVYKNEFLVYRCGRTIWKHIS